MASRKVRLINQLTHTKGPFAGQTFKLRDWQERDIIRPLFTTGADGRRVYRTCLLMMPRKNGKSEIAAALAIDGLLFDHEMGGEIYSAAADKDQASLVFNVAAQMIRNDHELLAQCEILDSQRRIVHRKSGSIYRAISAEAYSKHGFNASRVIYDELHCATSRDLWDVLTTSTGARDQPLMIAISTAGYDRSSILWELYAHAKKCLEDPTLDPSFLPIIYEAPADADWTDERVWRAANPALGDFRSLDELRIMAKRAQEIPAQENTFRRLYLNQWTEQASRWLSLAQWDACRVPAPVLERRRCYVGLDLSSTIDVTAAVAVFPLGDGRFFALPHFWIPGDRIRERVQRDHVPYDRWHADGVLDTTPGNVVDYEAVRKVLNVWRERFDVRELAYDPWNAQDLVNRLSEQDGFVCTKIPQGIKSLASPTKALEVAILNHTLQHAGDPILRWMIANVSVEQDADGNLKPSKKASIERIDGVVALVMAIARMEATEASKPKAYQLLIYGGTHDRPPQRDPWTTGARP
jgi:phage terminase large subunit-like protein